MTLHVDMSEIDNLAALLEAAGRAAGDGAGQALEKRTRQVFNAAKANAASFRTKSTGELAAAVEMEMIRDEYGIVRGPVRQAFFLEYGSPTTGAPRPWLSGPAEEATMGLLADIADIGGVW